MQHCNITRITLGLSMNNGWNDVLEAQMVSITQNCEFMRKQHEFASRNSMSWDKFYTLIVKTLLGISAIVLIFANLFSDCESNEIKAINIISGVIVIVAAGIDQYRESNGFIKNSGDHLAKMRQYQHIRDIVMKELGIYRMNRVPAEKFIDEMTLRKGNLDGNSPVIELDVEKEYIKTIGSYTPLAVPVTIQNPDDVTSTSITPALNHLDLSISSSSSKTEPSSFPNIGVTALSEATLSDATLDNSRLESSNNAYHKYQKKRLNILD